jgi:hypothetical protein
MCESSLTAGNSFGTISIEDQKRDNIEITARKQLPLYGLIKMK